ncbi:hypothetical protein Rs2_05019 [Raphanus sativus]|nr:hypothetical protein Rs2_05019 [Raphanus sativus]
MKALLGYLPKIWKVEARVTGTDLGVGKFQFDFEKEEDIELIPKLQLFHFDYWMLVIGRWQPKTSQLYPLEIPFWVRLLGIPSQFRTESTLRSIGDALGRMVDIDLDHTRVQVIIDGFKELCFETTIDFKGGEFYELCHDLRASVGSEQGVQGGNGDYSGKDWEMLGLFKPNAGHSIFGPWKKSFTSRYGCFTKSSSLSEELLHFEYRLLLRTFGLGQL